MLDSINALSHPTSSPAKEMTAEEAKSCVISINRNLVDARSLLLDLYERKGWSALGYPTFRDCVTNEFLQSQAYLYRLLAAGRIERNISPIGEKGIPEGQLRPLAAFEPETQFLIWEVATATAPLGKVTASHVELVTRIFKASSPSAEPTIYDFEDWASDPNPPYEVEEDEPASPQTQPMSLLSSSLNDGWRTPARYIAATREVLGGIELDPASSAIANETVQALAYWTKEDDALSRPWVARSIWLNPPYGKTNNLSNQGLFAHKLITEFIAGNVLEGIMLVNLYSGYGWFAPLRTLPMCLVDHRISFIDPETDAVGDEAKASSVFIYVGKDPRKFYSVFKHFGPCGQFSYDW